LATHLLNDVEVQASDKDLSHCGEKFVARAY